MFRKSTAVCAALATAASGLLIASANPASAASTYYACVKKSSGETKMVKKNKKCKKGWKKVKWTSTGPAGATGPVGPVGPAGTALNLKDASGAVIGPFLGSWSGLQPGFTTWIDGGIWTYGNDGVLYADSDSYYDSVYFTDPTCTAAVRWVERNTAAETAAEVAKWVPGAGRFVYRGTFVGAAARAWKISGPNALAVLNQELYSLGSSGSCSLYDTVSADEVAHGATLVGLAEVTPPANRPAPLTVG